VVAFGLPLCEDAGEMEGRLDAGAKMRPGAAVMAHTRGRVTVGCHRPWASEPCSAALRGRAFRPLAFFPRTLRVWCVLVRVRARTWVCLCVLDARLCMSLRV
jgi:hypothetical protein